MKMTPMLLCAALACGTAMAWAQNDDSTNAGQPANSPPSATQPSSSSSNQDTSSNNAQGNIDRSGIKKTKPHHTASNAYADCGDYNERSAAGSPPGSTDTNSQNSPNNAKKAQKSSTSRPDCPEKH